MKETEQKMINVRKTNGEKKPLERHMDEFLQRLYDVKEKQWQMKSC